MTDVLGDIRLIGFAILLLAVAGLFALGYQRRRAQSPVSASETQGSIRQRTFAAMILVMVGSAAVATEIAVFIVKHSLGAGATTSAARRRPPRATASDTSTWTAENYFVAGYWALDHDDYARAITLTTTALEHGEELSLEHHAYAYNNRGVAYANRRQYAEAFADFDAALALEQNYVNPHLKRGLALVAIGRNEDALASFSKAIDVDPEKAIDLVPRFSQAYAARGDLLHRLGRDDEAIADLDKAVALDARDVYARQRRAHFYADKRQWERVIADYDVALGVTPSAWDYVGRGNAYASSKRNDLAMADYDAAVRLAPRYAYAYSGRGHVHIALGEFDAAIADLTRAIAAQPDDADLYLSRAYAYYYKNDYERSITDLDSAIRLDPKSVAALYNRATSYDDAGRYDEAIADYSRAIELNPELASGYFNRANCYYRTGHYEKAIADYKKAISFRPDATDAIDHRGEALLATGEYSKAMADFYAAMAIRLNPDFAERHKNRIGSDATPDDGAGAEISR